MTPAERRHLSGLFVLALTFLSALCWSRHAMLRSDMFDLGIHHQVAWLLSHGREPVLSSRGLTESADHFNPVAWLFAAPLWVSDSPLVLLLTQSLLLAAGVFPVYLVARRHLTHGLALGCAGLYLLQPALLNVNQFDVHFSALLLPFALGAVWALEEGRPGTYAAAMVLMLSTTESAGFSVCVMAWPAWRLRGPKWALATLAVAGGGLAIAVFTLRWHGQGVATQYLSLYSRWGDRGSAILLSLATHPNQVLGTLLTSQHLNCLVGWLQPLAWLPLLSPARLAPCLPVVMGNWLSWRPSQQGIAFQYSAGVLPFLMWAMLAAVGRGHARLRRVSASFADRGTVWLLVLAAIQALVLGPLAPWNGDALKFSPGPEIDSALALIPPQASVATDNLLGSRLCGREQVFLFPNPIVPAAWGNRPQAIVEQTGNGLCPPSAGALRRALEDSRVDYIALWLRGQPFPWRSPVDRWYILRSALSSRTYGLIHRAKGVVVLKRGTPMGDPDALEEALVRQP